MNLFKKFKFGITVALAFLSVNAQAMAQEDPMITVCSFSTEYTLLATKAMSIGVSHESFLRLIDTGFEKSKFPKDSPLRKIAYKAADDVYNHPVDTLTKTVGEVFNECLDSNSK